MSHCIPVRKALAIASVGVAVLLSTNGAAADMYESTETKREKEKKQNEFARQMEEEENEGRLRGAELAQELQGPEIGVGPPTISFMPALAVRVPYQLLAVGATVELFPVPWLRVSATYSFGLGLRTDPADWTSYAEGLAGVRVFGTSSESAIDLELKRRGAAANSAVPVVKGWVPSQHGVFVEAGAMTGFTSLAQCPDPCGAALPLVERQLVMPVGGIRYVYSYDVRSAKRNVRKRNLIQAYVHVLGKPFNAPTDPLYLPDNTHTEEAGFGGRVGVVLPPFGCATDASGWGCFGSKLALGYAPYPRFLMLELELGVFVF